MIERGIKFFILVFLGIMISNKGTTQPGSRTGELKPVFSRLHTLSIHVRDTITHDSVFHFLADQLDLPVYYSPLKYGNRRYAGIYGGNLVLEPCGPYSNFSYASDDFRAVFFGLTFEPAESIPVSAKGLTDRNIQHEAGDDYIYNRDTALCAENITLSFLDKGQASAADERVMDSLASYINRENDLGIQYVKEIWIGYKDSDNWQKWREIISPEKFSRKKVWVKSNIEFHFIKSDIKEVRGITFKVKSLQKVKDYLLRNNLSADFGHNKIRLDEKQAFGLQVCFTE